MIKGADSESPSACESFVLGATGNFYTVKLNQMPSCSCPDAAKGNTCKHLLFVMLRVLKLPQSDPWVWQKALLSTKLEDLLNISTVNEGIIGSQRVRHWFHEISGTIALIDTPENNKKASKFLSILVPSLSYAYSYCLNTNFYVYLCCLHTKIMHMTSFMFK
jgi:hypothetical protein